MGEIFKQDILCFKCKGPTRDGQLCAVWVLLCTVRSFAVLLGVLMYVFIHGGVNCLNSVPYRCYMNV